MNEKLWKIQGGAFTKQLISHLLSVQECKTWFKINAKTRHAHKMIQCANNPIHDVKNIDENSESREKLKENKGCIPTK